MQIHKGFAVILAASWAISLAGACTTTTFVRDGINLTAALVNPNGNVVGDVDATGCHIGVYYGPGANGQVNAASIHGAIYFGVVNNGGNVQIQSSTIYDIGDVPFSGDQHGVGIYFAFGTNARGNIQGNTIWNYQKGGIVVNGNLAQSNIQNNTVIGQGPITYIAQNGIQMGYGAQGNIQNNLVVGNSYAGSGETADGGIILVGGPGNFAGSPTTSNINIQGNTSVGNDVGIWLSNVDTNGLPVTTQTKNQVQNNTIRNNSVTNTTGGGPIKGYQAGILDEGDGDTIQQNSICGAGYTGPSTPAYFVIPIDVTFTNNVMLQNNTTCSTATAETQFRTRTELGSAPTVHQPAHPQTIQ